MRYLILREDFSEEITLKLNHWASAKEEKDRFVNVKDV